LFYYGFGSTKFAGYNKTPFFQEAANSPAPTKSPKRNTYRLFLALNTLFFLLLAFLGSAINMAVGLNSGLFRGFLCPGYICICLILFRPYFRPFFCSLPVIPLPASAGSAINMAVGLNSGLFRGFLCPGYICICLILFRPYFRPFFCSLPVIPLPASAGSAINMAVGLNSGLFRGFLCPGYICICLILFRPYFRPFFCSLPVIPLPASAALLWLCHGLLPFALGELFSQGYCPLETGLTGTLAPLAPLLAS